MVVGGNEFPLWGEMDFPFVSWLSLGGESTAFIEIYKGGRVGNFFRLSLFYPCFINPSIEQVGKSVDS